MNTRNESRSSDVRENNMREDQWTFEEPNALEVPDSVKARFDAEGMAYRWIRISVRGVDDVLNVGKRLQEGWVLVAPDEVPELAISSAVRDEGR